MPGKPFKEENRRKYQSVFSGFAKNTCYTAKHGLQPALFHYAFPMDTRIDIIAHSPAALAIRALEKSGYQAWIVGGWVRDTLMGRMPHDADIATNAPWEHTKRIMRDAGYAVHETGVKHGTVTAIVSGEPIEITTYRIEGPYSDSRHPDYVEFVDSIELDLARRDFTMNAIAFHPTRGIFDPFDGASDIKARTIRAVGDARKRFEEDPLRILRAARFEAQTGFEIEPATRDAAFSCAHLLDSVARERTGSELTKLLCGPYAGRVIENEFPIVVQAINELEVARGFKLKSKRHAYDLLGHLAHSVSAAPENEALRWAALLHDIAKPESNHNHAQRSSIAATHIMQRLRIGRQQTQQAADAIAWHMTSFPPSEEPLRLFVACLGGDVPRARRALLLQRADASGHGPKGDAREKEVDEELAMLDALECSGKPLGAKQLALSGKEVAELGNLHGSEIGRTLDALLAAVVEGEVENTPEALRSHLNFAIENAEEHIFQKKLQKFLTKR